MWLAAKCAFRGATLFGISIDSAGVRRVPRKWGRAIYRDASSSDDDVGGDVDGDGRRVRTGEPGEGGDPGYQGADVRGKGYFATGGCAWASHDPGDGIFEGFEGA